MTDSWGLHPVPPLADQANHFVQYLLLGVIIAYSVNFCNTYTKLNEPPF